MSLRGAAARIDGRAVAPAAVVALLVGLLAGAVPGGAAPGGVVPRAPAPDQAPLSIINPAIAGTPYRLGYASMDAPRLAAVNADDGEASPAPTGNAAVDEASANRGGLVFVTHRPGQADTDLAYLAPGATSPVALTSDAATDRQPALAADGTSVAFESDRAGQFDIWVIRVDGTGLRRLTDDPADDTWPTWSPTGDRVVFSSTRDDPAGDLYLVPAGGGAVERLTDNPAADLQPAWSPVGETIAFTTTRFQPAGGTSADLATVTAAGGPVRRIGVGEEPAWSPDGSRLAFVTRAADPAGDVSVRTLASGAVMLLAGGPARAETQPTWRGSTVLYTEVWDGGAGGSLDIWSAAADGQDRRDHTNRPGADEAHPAFSPDGARLAYAEYGDRASRITVADADGRNPRPLTPLTARVLDEDPAWSPDGTMIAFNRREVPSDGRSDSRVLVVRVADGVLLGTIPVPDYLNGSDVEPAWAPDGVHLALSREATLRTPSVVTPGPTDRPVHPGGSTTVEQRVPTPTVPPIPDIIFAVDTTGSMNEAIVGVRQNLPRIIETVRGRQSRAQFGVVSYRSPDDGTALFEVRQQPTDRLDLLQTAVNGLVTGGGGEEDWLNALYRIATGAITFRPGGNPVVVLIGDASSGTTRHPQDRTIAALRAVGVIVVAVPVTGNAEDGLDARGQATAVTSATGGRLVPSASNQVAEAILESLIIDVTVTPTVRGCDPGLSLSFEPARLTVRGGTDAVFRQTATVAPGATIGATLRCTVEYLMSPNPGGEAFVVPVVVHVQDPGLPLVTVDDVRVGAQGPAGAAVRYTATAIDSAGRPLTPTCVPPPGATFPVGQTTVTCTATDSAGRVGRDTALITVVPEGLRGRRVWVATLAFPSADQVTVVDQVDVSARVGQPCPAGTDDRAPAWSPDGAALAFAADRVLCVVDPTGANARTPIVPAPTTRGAADPAWSPDGAVIAFGWSETAGGLTRRSIRTVPAGGGAPTVLVDTPGGAIQPAFVRVTVRDPNPALPSPGVTLTVTVAPQPAFVRGGDIQVTFTARNPARYPAARVRLDVEAPTALAAAPITRVLGSLPGGGTTTVTIALPATSAVTGLVRGLLSGVYAEDVPTSARAQAPIVVRQPVLTVNPPIGPPGFVPAVRGTEFPPGTTVTLRWSSGISATTRIVVAADGTFSGQMLVFHHDLLGNRKLVASGTGFGDVDTPFLVVAANQQPRDFVQRR